MTDDNNTTQVTSKPRSSIFHGSCVVLEDLWDSYKRSRDAALRAVSFAGFCAFMVFPNFFTINGGTGGMVWAAIPIGLVVFCVGLALSSYFRMKLIRAEMLQHAHMDHQAKQLKSHLQGAKVFTSHEDLHNAFQQFAQGHPEALFGDGEQKEDNN